MGSRNLSLYVGRSATKYHPDQSLKEGVVADGPRHLLGILHESIRNSLPRTAAHDSSRASGVECRHKRKAPVTGGFRFQLVRRIGFRASASRIRTGFARLPARSPARYGRSASASRSRLDRGSNPCGAGVKEKPPLPEALSSIGAAYRIRTYDVLIRSQTLYPAEVTPRLVDYYAHGLNNGQAFFQKKLLNLVFTHLEGLVRSSMPRDIEEQSLLGALKSIGATYRIPRIHSGFDRGSNLRNAPI